MMETNTMTPEQTRNEKAAKTVIKNLKARHFDAYYCATKEEAKDLVLSLIPQSDTVGWGGSMTIDALGIKDALRERGQTLFDRDNAAPEERMELFKKSLTANTFLTGTNAITENGELINVDGTGNRVAAIAFGPDSVIVVTGMNKLTKTVMDGAARARNYAAPVNAMRFGNPTPCVETGCCADCISEKSICNVIVRTRMSKPAGRIKVVLVGESLGF